MSRIRYALRAAGLTAGVAFLVGAFATPSSGFQRPPPAKEPGLGEAHVGCLGHGKGEVVLPVVGEDGRMSGQLLDCEGVREFRIEALLTGCMPAEAVGDRGYWFGGLYGKVWKLGGAPDPWIGAAASYGIEGTWRLYDDGQGTFDAEALQFTPSGRMVVVGGLTGKFYTDPDEPHRATLTWGDALVPGKVTKTRFGDAASEPDPWGDAASVPRKVYPKTPYGEARNKSLDQPFGDAASAPHKAWPKTPFREATTGPTPRQVGTFYLRFHFDV